MGQSVSGSQPSPQTTSATLAKSFSHSLPLFLTVAGGKSTASAQPKVHRPVVIKIIEN